MQQLTSLQRVKNESGVKPLSSSAKQSFYTIGLALSAVETQARKATAD